ncbi:phage portal protein [Alkalicoccobacillus gibsonii]|uniref:phage portal protein n=1 Tax=Alkalicoccobacillus gibsonii TaxID=79881 RepID=UPI003F7B9026
MFRRIKAFMRGVLQRMGLVKNVKSLSQLKDLTMDDKHYENIEMWKALYQGHFDDWHNLQYSTPNGTQKRRMASLGMPKVVANEMASLIFNERCEINISDDGLSEFIKSVMDNNKFIKRFQEYLEFDFSLGGMVIKPYVADRQVKLSYVTADCFIPVSWDNQGIYEGVFINETRKGKKIYTLLEWHLWENEDYIIRNELFVSENNSEVGKQVPLSTLYPNLKEEIPPIKKFKRANFVYFKPNIANNIDMHSPLGIPLIANSLDTLKSLDIAFDSYQREFRLGKRRIIVPATALRMVTNENGVMMRYFDADDEVYEGLDLGDAENNKIQDNTVELRVEEHIGAINSLLNLLAMQTGFSAGTFSFDGKSMKTATEVVSENSKTFKTKQSHENVIEAGLTELIDVIVQTAELYGLYTRPAEKWEVTVSFDDSIAEDKTAEINKQIQLVSNRLTSKLKAIMKIHGLTEKEAELLMQQIADENKMANGESVDFFGLGDRHETGR